MKKYTYNDPLNMEIGGKIREIREVKEMTETQLAQAAGLCRSQVSEYENGTVGMSAKRLCEIAEALHVPLSALQPASLDRYEELSRRLDILSRKAPAEKRRVLSEIILLLIRLIS